MRTPVRARERSRATIYSLPAPVKGLYLDRAAASQDPLAAEVLDNWIPTDRGVRIRGGMRRVANLGAPVVSLFAYVSPTTPRMFATTASAIFDVSGLDPDATLTAAVSGLSAGYFSTQQIGTVGGDFLYAVNGADSARLFNGSTWATITGASSPAITGVTTSTLSHVWLYRNRLLFVQKDTLRAWYLPVDSVGGAAQSISLAGVFKRGGALLFGATWSLDAGDGIDDKCVFVSTEGEVAIYEGSDPSDVNEWRLVGRYDVARPLGRNCTMQAGGDLLIATTEGIVPLSAAINKDPAALSLSAVSRPIESLWSFEAGRNTGQVELLKWATNGIALVVLPSATRMLAINLQTGAWAPQEGWAADCATLFLDRAFAGFSDGYVRELDVGGTDDGTPFTARYCGSFSDLRDATQYKRAQMIRFAFFAANTFNFRAGVAFDYAPRFDAAPNAASVTPTGDFLLWDVGDWDEKVWWSPDILEQQNAILPQWRTISGAGFTIAPTLQITSGQSGKLNIELVRTDMAIEVGGSVV